MNVELLAKHLGLTKEEATNWRDYVLYDDDNEYWEEREDD